MSKCYYMTVRITLTALEIENLGDISESQMNVALNLAFQNVPSLKQPRDFLLSDLLSLRQSLVVITYRSASCNLMDCDRDCLTYFTVGNHNSFISGLKNYSNLQKSRYILCISIPEDGTFRSRGRCRLFRWVSAGLKFLCLLLEYDSLKQVKKCFCVSLITPLGHCSKKTLLRGYELMNT